MQYKDHWHSVNALLPLRYLHAASREQSRSVQAVYHVPKEGIPGGRHVEKLPRPRTRSDSHCHDFAGRCRHKLSISGVAGYFSNVSTHLQLRHIVVNEIALVSKANEACCGYRTHDQSPGPLGHGRSSYVLTM